MSKRLKNLLPGAALAAITVPCSCLLLWQVVVVGTQYGLEYIVDVSLIAALSLVAVVTVHEEMREHGTFAFANEAVSPREISAIFKHDL